MCGIFGAVSAEVDALPGTDVAKACLRRMAHRGPDAEGLEYFSAADSAGVLGHVRLSIIDLQGGQQPMSSADGNLLLSYNGEIYNYLELKAQLQQRGHRFVEQSDTEVLLHAYREWGEQCLQHLRGMFAFAIWDHAARRLFMARDHFGKKPLFYVEHGECLYFASEIKALLAIPQLRTRFNREQLQNYCLYRYFPCPATPFDGIHKLPPGSSLSWERGASRVQKWFVPAEARARSTRMSRELAVKRFWELLDESVRLRMAADVPFGAFLSGGIDSSAVVALMSEHSSQRVRTFSVGFRESGYSELDHARLIAEQFNTEHRELVVAQDELMELLPELVRLRDAPVCEPSDIPIYLLAREARKTVKMVLTGEGSDEVLGGYPKHSFERLLPVYQCIPGLLRRRVIAPLVAALPYRFRRAKTAVRNMNSECFDERMPGWFGAMTADEARALVAAPEQAPLPHLPLTASGSSLRNILLFDQMSWLPDNLLERGDRMSMAASLEARMPFMDVELARFAASLPDSYRIRGRSTKWILRQAMRAVLPQSILERPKVGFRVPVNLWFQGSMKDYLLEHLRGEASLTRGLYHARALDTLLDDHIQGRQNHEKALWMLLNLEIWMRQNEQRMAELS